MSGVPLHYTRMGTGAEVVLIHGLGANRAFWFLRIAPELARTFTVTIYDLRGHGYSGMPISGYTSDHMASDLHALINHLGVRRAHFVGHSFGGAVALHFASRYPRRVATLTLADARVPAFEPEQRLKDWPQWEDWQRRLRSAGMPVPDGEREFDLNLLREWAQPQWRQAREKLAAAYGFAPFVGWRGSARAVAGLDRLVEQTSASRDVRVVAGLTRACIARVHCPVLGIYGQYSHCLSSLQGLQETLLDCTTQILPSVGHFHPAVKPGEFVRHVRKFIKEHSS